MQSATKDLEVLLRIDAVCEDFEARWQEGSGPRIAEFLERVPPADRVLLVRELVALEVGLRRERGERLSADELLASYAPLLPATENDESSLRSTIEKALSDTGKRSRLNMDATQTFARPAASGALPLPTVEGFEIESVLGRGGMGIVFKAWQKFPKRPVALKMILDDRVSDGDSAEFFARFAGEAQAVADLNDPNFVQIYSFGDAAGRPYMALEYIDGGSLEQLRRGEPQADKYSAAIVEQLARGMHKCHQANLIHRDLKPQNVLLTARGEPKIADFGLAKRLDQEIQLTEDGRGGMGTPSYMAPEQTYGGSRVGPAADIYALGAILYCLLTGRPPFQAANRYDIIEQVRHQEPVAPRRLNPKIAQDLDTICLHCLEKDPARRYLTAEELANDLRCFLENRPIRIRPVGQVERTCRWAKRNPWIAGLGSAVALLVLTVAVVSTAMVVQLALKNETISTQYEEIRQKGRALTRTNDELESTIVELEEKGKALTETIKNLKIARKATLDQFTSSLGLLRHNVFTVDGVLRSDPKQYRLRKQLIDQAMLGIDQLRKTTTDVPLLVPDDPLVERTEAAAYHRMGEMYLRGGRVAEAAEAYQRALTITKRAAETFGDDPALVWNLGAIHNLIGDVQLRRGATSAARAHYEEAFGLRKRWADIVPDESRTLQPLAVSHTLLAKVAMRSGDPSSALAHLKEATMIYDTIPQPKVPKLALEFRQERADCALRLAEACCQLDRLPEAERYFQEALTYRNETALHFQSAMAVRDVALSHMESGTFHLLHQRAPVKALQHYLEADKRFQYLAVDPSDVVLARQDVAAIQYRLGVTYRRMREQNLKQSDGQEAPDPSTCFETSRAIREELAQIDPTDAQAQIAWAMAEARAGRIQQAKTLADKLMALNDEQQDPYVLYQVACTLALCSENAEEEFADQCRKEACATVKKLLAAGWQDYMALKVDPDLEPLHQDAEYMALVEKQQAVTPP